MKDIIRFKQNGKKILIMAGVKTEQAQEWCSSPLTKGKDYFDGFAQQNTYCVKSSPKYTHYFTPNEIYN